MEDREQSTWKKVAGKETARERRDTLYSPQAFNPEYLRISATVEYAAGTVLIQWIMSNNQKQNMFKCWHTGSKCQRIRYLLPAAPSVRLVQQPCAEDWVHVDSYALNTNQQDSTWRTEQCRKIANQRCNSASLKRKDIKAIISKQFLHNKTGHVGKVIQYSI